MDHNRATETQAVERYLLGELPVDEREAFEEHYFTCRECAEDLRAAARFRDNARAVLQKPNPFPAAPQKDRRRGASWWRFPQLVPLAASVLLLGVVVYQGGVEIPSLKRAAGSPAAVEAAARYTAREATRGVGTNITRIPAGLPRFSVDFDLPPATSQPLYECTITDAGGKQVGDTVVSVPPNEESLSVYINRALPAGVYSITVRGAAGAVDRNVVTQVKFQVE